MTPPASGIAWADDQLPITGGALGALPPTERDALVATNLVRTTSTHVGEERVFYGGSPEYYMGGPYRIRGTRRKHPYYDKRQGADAGSASAAPFRLAHMLFYDGAQIPAQYQGDVFAAEHGFPGIAERAGTSDSRSGARRQATGDTRIPDRVCDGGGTRLGPPGGCGSCEGRFGCSSATMDRGPSGT